MTDSQEVSLKINLVSETRDGAVCLTLNEEGPWEESEIDSRIAKLGQRLSDCVSSIINGNFALRYPQSKGRAFIIRVQSFETPKIRVESLVKQLDQEFRSNQEIQSKLITDRYAQSISIIHDWVDWATVIAASQSNEVKSKSFLEKVGAIFKK